MKGPPLKHHSQEFTIDPATGTGWETLQSQLQSAADKVRLAAMTDKRHGILVTRHRQNTFTVAVSPDVPYGMAYERDNHPRIR